MKILKFFGCLIVLSLSTIACKDGPKAVETPQETVSTDTVTATKNIKLIFDTDANNELDDQHALAYMLMSGATFDVRGITVNTTRNGAGIQSHYDEAERILQLCNLKDSIPLLKGADGNFETISKNFNPLQYDGQEGVDFILEASKKDSVVIVAVGKLTNIALALKKDPSFAKRSRIVWLGSNYPEPGEYNQNNDTIAMNYVLNSSIPFEMVTVRYGKPSGSDAVSVTKQEIGEKMPGLGPIATEPITGRHGGTFSTFGDYSVNLFEHIFDHVSMVGPKNSRALFDMVALAVLKDPSWGTATQIPAPILIDDKWVARPDNPRKITVWENFEKTPILDDFFQTLTDPVFVSIPKA